MITVVKNNDIAITATVLRKNVPEDFSQATEIIVKYRHAMTSINISPQFSITGNVIQITAVNSELTELGFYDLEVSWKSANTKKTPPFDNFYFRRAAFCIVKSNDELFDDESKNFDGTLQLQIVIDKNQDGRNGLSAFEIWSALEGNENKTIDDYYSFLKKPATDASLAAGTVISQIEELAEEIIVAENGRSQNENTRNDSEILRTENEVSRQNAEGDATKGRVKAENDRQTSETTRSQNEQNRQTAETTRTQNESTRVINETNRVNAENARNIASNLYNITLAIPLQAGSFYDKTSAINAVPAGIRKQGLMLSYATSATTWEVIQFIGSSTANWTTLANWQKVIDEALLTPVEKVTAEALIAIYSKVLALEEFIKNSTFEGAQIDTLTVVKSILFQGAKIFNSGAGAPTSTPDFIGQEYTNTTTKVGYKAVGVDSAADWKQITN